MVEGLEGAGVELAERRAQLVDLPLWRPDQGSGGCGLAPLTASVRLLSAAIGRWLCRSVRRGDAIEA